MVDGLDVYVVYQKSGLFGNSKVEAQVCCVETTVPFTAHGLMGKREEIYEVEHAGGVIYRCTFLLWWHSYAIFDLDIEGKTSRFVLELHPGLHIPSVASRAGNVLVYTEYGEFPYKMHDMFTW